MNNPSDSLFLGVDGGATNCRARLVGPDGRVLGEGRSGTANPRHGLERAFASILDATRQALAQAGLPDADLGRIRAGLGLAGVGQKADRDLVLRHPHPFASIAVETDAHAACLGAHQGRDGAILVVGTGSCGVAIVGGRAHQVGGWGFPVSDHGSGAWLGLEAVRRALFAHDGAGSATPFTRAVMAKFGDDPERIVAWMSEAQPRDYAGLAPLVLDWASQEDPAATALVREAAGDLVRMMEALDRFGARNLCLMGGLADPMKPWLPADRVAGLVPPQGDAADGAIMMARRSTVPA